MATPLNFATITSATVISGSIVGNVGFDLYHTGSIRYRLNFVNGNLNLQIGTPAGFDAAMYLRATTTSYTCNFCIVRLEANSGTFDLYLDAITSTSKDHYVSTEAYLYNDSGLLNRYDGGQAAWHLIPIEINDQLTLQENTGVQEETNLLYTYDDQVTGLSDTLDLELRQPITFIYDDSLLVADNVTTQILEDVELTQVDQLILSDNVTTTIVEAFNFLYQEPLTLIDQVLIEIQRDHYRPSQLGDPVGPANGICDPILVGNSHNGAESNINFNPEDIYEFNWAQAFQSTETDLTEYGYNQPLADPASKTVRQGAEIEFQFSTSSGYFVHMDDDTRYRFISMNGKEC